MNEILIRVWREDKKEMSGGMPPPMIAGYLSAIYPKLGNEKYMLCSGLKDTSDKLIYDGDFVKYTVRGQEVLDEVQFAGGFFGVKKYAGMLASFYPITVVGNIYETPLLKN